MKRFFEICGSLVFAAAVFLSLPALAGSDDGMDVGDGASTYSVPGIEIGGFVAEDGSAGEINAILPLSMPTSDQLLFIGADAKLFEGSLVDLGESVYNAGAYLGYRERKGSATFGAWMGADILQTASGNTFQRFIAGVEYFDPRGIVRVNAFAPFDAISDEWTIASAVYDEKVSAGIDGEVGLRFAIQALQSAGRNGEFRLFAGGYDYFELDPDGGDVVGVRGRLELDLYPFEEAPETRLTLDASYSHDDYADGQFAGGVRLSIPLGSSERVAANYGGSLKDGSGSLKDGPRPVVSLESQDLFQPVRRNREPVSLIRRKQSAGFYTLATVCGGGSIPISNPAINGPTSITAGDLIGVLSDGATTGPNLFFNLADLVSGTGSALTELLEASTTTFSALVSLPIPAPYTVVDLDTSLAPSCFSEATGLTVSINSGICEAQYENLSQACASDRRLKRDIQQIAVTADGIKLYSYKYIESFDASGTTYVGVMAQDLETSHPEALVLRSDGYFAVRYDLIGLRMSTLSEWQDGGRASVVDQHSPVFASPASLVPSVGMPR